MRSALVRMGRALAGEAREPEDLPWWELRRPHILALQAWLGEHAGLAPATINTHMSALRGVLREAWLLGLVGAEDYHRAADVKNVRHQVLPRGRALSAGEIRALFDACARDEGPAGPRDAAILGVLYGGGLRRDEAARLELSDLDLEAGELRLVGKGRIQRRVYLPAGAQAALEDWLVHRAEAPGPLWTRVRRGGHLVLPLTGLTDRGVTAICERRAREANVKAFGSHDLRRTFISDLLDQGVDLATVQKLAGHASPRTTSRYDRRGERVMRRAAKGLHVPWRRV